MDPPYSLFAAFLQPRSVIAVFGGVSAPGSTPALSIPARHAQPDRITNHSRRALFLTNPSRPC